MLSAPDEGTADEGLLGPGLLADPSLVPVTPTRGFKPRKPAAAIPPDGSMTVDRRCKVEKDPSGWMLLNFLDDPSRQPESPRWALPCELLEALEQAAASRGGAVFRLSGENTVYRGQSFLLLTKVTVEMADVSAWPRPGAAGTPVAAPAPGSARPQPASRPAVAAAAPPAPATGPATRPASRPASVSPDDVFNALVREKPVRPVAAPVRPAVRVEDVPSVAPKPAAPAEKELESQDRRLIADRTVRLLATGVGQWKEVRFDSDNTLQEPPMRIIPCAMLERMEGKSKPRRSNERLQVSGVVTRYKGREYLLLRKALPVRDLGQF